MAVERGKGLVKQQKSRIADQDTRKRDPLLLPAGELVRLVVLQPLQLQHIYHFAQVPFFLRTVLLTAQPAEDVLPYCHIREKRIVLEKIPHAPLLRRQVDLLLRIVQHPPVEFDMSLVGLFNTGDAL